MSFVMFLGQAHVSLMVSYVPIIFQLVKKKKKKHNEKLPGKVSLFLLSPFHPWCL